MWGCPEKNSRRASWTSRRERTLTLPRSAARKEIDRAIGMATSSKRGIGSAIRRVSESLANGRPKRKKQNEVGFFLLLGPVLRIWISTFGFGQDIHAESVLRAEGGHGGMVSRPRLDP